MPGYFQEIEIGRVVSLGAAGLAPKAVEAFCDAFAPGWDISLGAPDAMIYAIWSKLDMEAASNWPQTKRLAVDALRWARNPPAGRLVFSCLTRSVFACIKED